MENIIEVRNLVKEFTVYKKKGFVKRESSLVKAVSDISFDVAKGEILAFIGPNGAGKSTTIKMLTGILQPTSGDISVMGYNPSRDRRKIAYHIGTVFGQKSQLWFHLPPRDSFELLGSIYDVPKEKLKKRVDYLTEVMEIEDLLDIPVRKLSLGQRIRCEIAASLIHSPEIMFLDEPTIGLDVIAKKNLRNLIKRVNQEEKTTIFLTSHDMGDIEKLCRRMIIINCGKILLDDDVKNLKYNYDNKKVISIRYTEDIEKDIDGISIVSRAPNALKVEVDTEKSNIDEVIGSLFKLGAVDDISISSKPLEDIIGDIYSLRQVRGGA